MANKPNSNSISILIVDDNSDIVQTLRQLFAMEPDFHVTGTARNGQEGVALALKLRPDVILMNCSMPVMDGLEATSYIVRRIPQAAIIMLSFGDDPEMIDAAFRAGVMGYFIKPIVHLDELIHAIHMVYDQSTAAALILP